MCAVMRGVSTSLRACMHASGSELGCGAIGDAVCSSDAVTSAGVPFVIVFVSESERIESARACVAVLRERAVPWCRVSRAHWRVSRGAVRAQRAVSATARHLSLCATVDSLTLSVRCENLYRSVIRRCVRDSSLFLRPCCFFHNVTLSLRFLSRFSTSCRRLGPSRRSSPLLSRFSTSFIRI